MKVWRNVWIILWSFLGLGAGLFVSWRALPLLWPLALVLIAVWLARWPRPGVWLLAATFGVMLASPFVGDLEQQSPTPHMRETLSTP